LNNKPFSRPFRVILVCLFLFPAVAAFPADFGILLNQAPQLEDTGNGSDFSWTGALIPRFSVPLGERSLLYLSGGINAKYRKEEGWRFIPELYRFEALFRGPSRMGLRAGRLEFRDLLGFTADGLFDGASAWLDGGWGTFRAAAFYTGLLHKKTARIVMTAGEQEEYDAPVEGPSSYFAPARAFAVLGWDHPGGFSTELLGQFDLRGGDEPRYHSQYLTLKYARSWNDSVTAELGGVAELIELEAEDPALGFGTFLSLGWMLPGAAADRLSFAARWTSGKQGDALAAFNPVTANTQGRVLQAKLSGIAVFEAAYLIRPVRPLAAEVSALYFIRTDGETFPVDGDSDSYLLGAEFDGRLTWVPASDVSFILDGGVFLPQNAYPSSEPRWRLSLGVMFSLY
jgi:hypothetical protein